MRYGLENNTHLDDATFFLCAAQCLFVIKTEVNNQRYKNADCHRQIHEKITISTRYYCHHCAAVDEYDFCRLYAHYFNLFPKRMLNRLVKSSLADSASDVFTLYTIKPYEGGVYGLFKWPLDSDYQKNVIERALKIPKWFLIKYFNYIVPNSNRLTFILKEANPGRAFIDWYYYDLPYSL